jgi:hypothetical protein
MLAAAVAITFLGSAVPQDPPPAAAKVDPFVAARTAWAERFMDGPLVHLALAKLHRDHHREELAVVLCEEARQRFGDKKFDPAFLQVFAPSQAPEPPAELTTALRELEASPAGQSYTSAARRDALDALAKRFPDAHEVRFLQIRAMEARGEVTLPAWEAALARWPDSATLLGWTARSRWTEAKDHDGALELAQRTYLRDPRFYDVMFMVLRIEMDLGPARSFARYDQAKQDGDFRKALSLDRFWGVERAVQKLRKDWQPAFVADAVRMLAHDSSGIRWEACRLLVDHSDDVDDDVLDALLTDPDLRVRGLAIYIAVKARGDEALPTASAFLASDVQLLRFDAISALSRHGGTRGKQLRDEHAKKETDPALVEMLQRSGKR